MKVCSVDGCDGEAKKRGWCLNHYKRWWRHGDPLARGSFIGSRAEFLLKSLATETDECLEWPYGNNGYGYGNVWIDGANEYVHVVAATIKHGQKPTPKHEVAHSCNHRACINPKHLRWATRSENFMDKVGHDTHNRGERHARVKLTEKQVLEIRALLSQGMPEKEVAELYDVSRSCVCFIKHRRNWAWLEDRADCA